MAVGLAGPGRGAEHFARLLRERLGALRLAAPVEAIRLEAGNVEFLLEKNKNLFGSPLGDEDWLRLVERLQARLGSGAVQTTTIANDASTVHSRHTMMGGKLMPSQYYGTCQ